jgi:hypothetical protein
MNIKEMPVFVQTNDAASNQIVMFSRREDGGLASVATYDTGGRGTGSPHLPSQGSVLAADGRVLVANAGSDDVSVFAIGPDGVTLVDRAAAGSSPRSVAAHGDLLYVLGTGGLTGLRLSGAGELSPIQGSERQLSASEADGAQVSFTPSGDRLVVTERVTDAISIYAVGADGLLDGPTVLPSSGATPYGFDLQGGRDPGRHGGVRRSGRRGSRVVVSAKRIALGGQPVRKEHPQRGLLGSRFQGRSVRIRDQFRRQHDLELPHRRRRHDRPARTGSSLHQEGREGSP